MLVVVEDGDVAHLFEPLFDLKAARRGDVFEVDAAEAAGNEGDGLDDVVDLFGAHAQRECVHAAERLEQRAFALHDGHTGFGTDVSESEDGGAVGDDRDEVRPAGVDIREVYVLGDLEAGLGDSGGICDREFGAVGDGCAGDDFDLAAPFAVFSECEFFLVHDYLLFGQSPS